MKGVQLLQRVNNLSGTYSHFGLSTGNCLPLTAVPFGLVHWSVETASGPWFFHPEHRKFRGFRATHQPSPWMGDYGQLTLMPVRPCPRYDAEGRASSYDRSLEPHQALVHLVRYGITATLQPRRTGALVQIESHRREPLELVLEYAESVRVVDPTRVEVICRRNSGGVPDGFATHYLLELSSPVFLKAVSEEVWVLAFEGTPESVEVKVGTSFISHEQAAQNILDDDLAPSALAAWSEIFGAFDIQDDNRDAIDTFANAVYRTHLFPRETHEFGADGSARHYSFFSGSVEPGVAVTDNGFWDTYRTVYPWFNLVKPSRSAIALNGWNAALQEGGWFPQWASPGYRACMVGTHIDAVIADAVVKGVLGFDAKLALSGMLKHANEVGDAIGSYGRLGIQDYLAKGYVAEEAVEASVSRSLDYAYNDFCIAQVLRSLGDPGAEGYEERAQNYRKLWDASVGFMRARHGDGDWAKFDPFEWGGPYVEGGAWQCSWAVQHDPAGLIELLGGDEKTVAKLMELIQTPPYFGVGHYGFEIHEMTEMVAGRFGQYAHSNQPVHHVLYLFALAGRLDLTQQFVTRAMKQMYTPERLPGDEDNGEMSAWYLFSSLGFFPFCPGRAEYVVGLPMFAHAEVTRESGQVLRFTKEDGASGLPSVNGLKMTSPILSHEVLLKDCTLAWHKPS